MKPVIIDRSLTDMKFSVNTDEVNKKAMFMYVCALAEAGAAYVELDFQSVVRLPKPSGAENYIYRLGAPEEFVVANALNFSYAVVPLEYHYMVPKLEIPTILEIDCGNNSSCGGGDDVFAILQLVSSNIDLAPFGMLRLVGDFDPDEIPTIISTYRRRSVIPLDICPTNNSLTALSSAIAAYRTDVDSVTVSFGDCDKFASLEELLIMLSAMYKIIVSPDYLEGICKASLFSEMFCENKTTNLSMMMAKYMYRPMMIENIDLPIQTDGLRPPSFKQNQFVRGNPASRVLNTMGIEQEMSDEIIKVLEDCNMELTRLKNKDEDLQ